MSAPVLTQLEIPDYDLGLRGKLLRPEKALGAADGLRFCSILYGLSLAGEVTDTLSSNKENGYPDARVGIDESTRIELPWRNGAQAVIGDLFGEDGLVLPASPRGQVVRLQEAFSKLGYTPMLGFEYEVWLFDQRGPHGVHPAGGRTESAYSLSRSHALYELASTFVEHMGQVGIPIEVFHPEQGPGAFEFAMKYQPAVQAADAAARARQYFRDIASDLGLKASFMAKPYGDKPGAGGHVHASLARAGVNVFGGESGQLSEVGAQFVAGLVETLGEYVLLFNPFVNSWKRIDKESWVAGAATWGRDDRRAACRVITDTVEGARVEHRRPGADANPYLVAAGVLAGGFAGVDEGLSLAQPRAPRRAVSDSMADGIRAFEASPRAAAAFGDQFVQGYAATRRTELAQYESWLRTTVSAWELDRYMEYL